MRMRKHIVIAFIFGAALLLSSRAGDGDELLRRMTSQEALSKFVAGNLAYQGGDYDRAVTEYESVLRSGLESGALYYNLGNAYFKKHKLGKAVLNYERARQFLPRDGDVNFNYLYALSQARTPSSVGKKSLVAKLMDKHAVFYTEAEMVWIIVVLSALIAALHLASLYLKWPLRRRRGVLAVLAVCLVVYICSFVHKVQRQEGLAIVTNRAFARFEPRADATSHFALGEGERIKVLKAEEGWAKIERPDGKTGWVEQADFEHI